MNFAITSLQAIFESIYELRMLNAPDTDPARFYKGAFKLNMSFTWGEIFTWVEL